MGLTRSRGPVGDLLALRDLAESYAAAVDARDAALLVPLFTDDAVVTVHRADRENPTAVFDGAAELPALTTALAARYTATFHIVGNHRAHVTGDTATAETYCTAHHLHRGPDTTPYDLQMLVRYADTCVRGTDGLWRFHRRTVTALWHSLLPAAGSVLDRADT